MNGCSGKWDGTKQGGDHKTDFLIAVNGKSEDISITENKDFSGKNERNVVTELFRQVLDGLA